ncbi:unnamed protein product [Mesocestoides corti]|nr:unnamed protein product [Mesocestoides corti]
MPINTLRAEGAACFVCGFPRIMQRPEVKYTQLFINNEFVNSKSGKTFEVQDPATQEIICRVQEGDAADIDLAVKAAAKAFEVDSVWRTMDASKRGRLLYELADLIEKNAGYIAHLESLDVGKPVGDAKVDVAMAIKGARYFAGYADKTHGKVIPVDGNSICWTRHEPVGVVAIITPWNFPFFLCMQKITAALCVGCTVVAKPAENTPLTAIFLASLFQQVGFPPGVVNIVPGFGATAGAALIRHPLVNSISFTGSTAVGKFIQATAAETTKRVGLELGGKSALIIFADADFEKAARTAHETIMANAGQVCVGSSRAFVQDEIYDRMVQRLKELAEERRVGDPFDPATVQGPQVSQLQFDRVMKYIEMGRKEGARLVTGGERVGDRGYFIQPTVFADVTDDMTIAREEIFGPVQSILRFSTLEEVIRRANSSDYGLGGGVFTSDMDKAMRVAQSLQAGCVWINSYMVVNIGAPFGGFKRSGIGREM